MRFTEFLSPRLLAVHARVITLKGWRAAVLALVAGFLSAGAMAPFYFFPILAITLPACVWLIDGTAEQARPLRAAAWRGWSFGFGYFLAGLYWIGYSFLVDATTHLWLLPFAAVLLPGGLALFLAAAFVSARFCWREGYFRIVVLAVMLSASEWLRGHLFTGLPWNLFGYGLGGSVWLIQFASLVGIYGLSLVTILAALSPAALVQADGKLAPNALIPLLAIAIPAGLAIYGWMRVPSKPQADIRGVRIRVVQPNVPQAEKWKSDLVVRNWHRLIDPLSVENGSLPYTHVIWPEAAPPFLLAEQSDARQAIAATLPQDAVLLTGAVFRDEVEGRPRFYNGMHVVDDAGAIVATYAKAHLVPFGEYLPFGWLLERVGVTKLTGGQGGFTSGPGVRSITTLTKNGLGTTFGPLICYEVVFPGAVIESGNRPDWLVNLTDDSWFGPSTGPYQHLGISQMRAVEEGMSIVRAANTGISAVIDPYGRLVRALPINQIGQFDSGVPERLSETWFARFGNVIYTAVMASLFAWIGWGPLRRFLGGRAIR